MTSLAAVNLPRSTLSDDERSTVERLLNVIEQKHPGNILRERYYDGKQRVQDMRIAIPPHLRMIETVVGWPGTVVDVLEERLHIDGWDVPGVSGDMGLSEIVEANQLYREYGQSHLDAFVYGIAFITVGTGGVGEPNPLITVESPKWMTAEWDRRKRGVSAALSVTWGQDGQPSAATLYVPRSTISLERSSNGWKVADRDDHDLPRPPVVRLVNRPRTGDTDGRSWITRAVRSITDNAVRTVLGMEVAREFFSAPQRYILGADESAFTDAEGNPKTAWETYLGRYLALTADENGNKPEVGQFAAGGPGPYLDQLRGLAQLLAGEAALPPSYLGIIQDNPASADAILAGEARLVMRAKRCHTTFGPDHGEAKRLALWIRDGEDPGVTPVALWSNPGTPTPAAAADAAVKLVGAGILPPDSDVTRERVGLSGTDRMRLAEEDRRTRARQLVTSLADAARAARTDPTVAEMSERRGDADTV